MFVFLFLIEMMQLLMAKLFLESRKEEQSKRGDYSLNFYRNRLKKRGQEFLKKLHFFTQLITQWYVTTHQLL